MDNPSGEPGPVFKLSVVTVALAAGVGLIHVPIPVVTEQAAKADDLVNEVIGVGHRATYRRSVWKST
jgi:hypothetical protein